MNSATSPLAPGDIHEIPGSVLLETAPIGELAAALAKAQLGFLPVVKKIENTFYSDEEKGKKSYYADLAAVIAATQKALATNGLVVIQTPIVDHVNKMAGVKSLLVHSSGQLLENTLLLPATAERKDWKQKDDKGNPGVLLVFNAQTIGIACTYARRYSYQSIIGVAAEQDDDANAISIPQGTVEAAQAVAADKIKDLEAKKSQQASKTPAVGRALPLGAKVPESGEEKAQGLIRSVERLKASKAPYAEYRRVNMILHDDAEASFVCFSNHKYQDDSTLFGLLDLTQSVMLETKRPTPATFMVVNDGKGSKIIRPLQLGDLTFDDAGFKEIQNSAR